MNSFPTHRYRADCTFESRHYISSGAPCHVALFVVLQSDCMRTYSTTHVKATFHLSCPPRPMKSFIVPLALSRPHSRHDSCGQVNELKGLPILCPVNNPSFRLNTILLHPSSYCRYHYIRAFVLLLFTPLLQKVAPAFCPSLPLPQPEG